MNNLRCDLSTMIEMNNKYNLTGDVVEFGTCTCQSAIYLAQKLKNKTIYTIDHFMGLEKTSKPLPFTSDWREGAFALGRQEFQHLKEFPKSIEEAKQKLATENNITLILKDIHDLTDPKDYDIGKVSLINIDVDIYEPTVSALEFVSKMEWSELFIRFDDWHGHEAEYDQHERLAFQEWIDKYQYEYEITHGGLCGGVYVKR